MQSGAVEWTVAELLNRCSRRPPDDVAWQEFVRRYNATIRVHVVKTFHQKVTQEADRKPQFPEDVIDDLIQAVYMRLVEDQNRALSRFEGEYENSIYQYLAMISINVVRDHFREVHAKKRPKVSFSLDEILDSGSGILDEKIKQMEGQASANSSTSLSFEDIERALNKAVSKKNRDRDILIFKLRFYEGLTLDEITKALGLDISPVSVGSILNRILRKVRPLLDPGGKRT